MLRRMANKSTHRTRRSFGGIRARGKRWTANYTHEEAMHRAPHSFDTKDDAVAWIASERKKIDLGIWTAPGAEPTAEMGLTVRKYAEKWFSETVNRHKPRTRALNRGYLTNVILPDLVLQL